MTRLAGRSGLKRLILFATLLVSVLGWTAAARAATYSPGTTTDTAPGTQCDPASGTCSLREIIEYEDGVQPSTPDTIVLDDRTYSLSNGDLYITTSLNLRAIDPGRAIVNGGGVDRVFTIVNAGNVSIDGLQVTGGNGNSSQNSGNPGFGGGIWVSSGSTLSLSRSEVDGNSAAQAGGGIDNDGTLDISASTIDGNTIAGAVSGSAGTGGGIDSSANALAVTLLNATVANNSASGAGAGIYIGGGSLTTSEVTVSGNTSSGAGPGGIAPGGNWTTSTTIVAGNQAGGSATVPSECSSGPAVDNGYNLEGEITCGFSAGPGDKQNTNPGLGTLANYGGPTPTLPLTGGPAVDAAPASACTATDQRGVPRPQGSACDIGAYELYVSGLAGYAQTSNTQTVSAGAENLISSACPVGDQAVGGGFRVSDPTAGVVLLSLPFVDGTAWAVTFLNSSNAPVSLTVVSDCVTRALPIATVQTTRYFDGQSQLTTTASCPAGSEVVGGGFNLSAATMSVGESDPSVSSSISSSAWTVSAAGNGGGGHFDDVALCAVTNLPGYEEPSPGSSSLPAGASQTFTANCSNGNVLLGGGFLMEYPGPTGQRLAGEAPSTGTPRTAWDVSVLNSDTRARIAQPFAVCATPVPVLTSINPAQGPQAGGQTITLQGSGLAGVSSVRFGAISVAVPAHSNDSTITVTTPRQGTGQVAVVAVSPGGTSNAEMYAYLAPPTVTSLSPSAGPQAGGQSVTISGTNLSDVSAVNFGATPATTFSVDPNGTSITATAPAGTGTVDVTVSSPTRGPSATASADRYTYLPPPTVTSLAPSAGPQAGGQSVTISGTNLSDVSAVNFGATPATTFSVDPNGTSITATAPAGTGTVDVTVSSPTRGPSATTSADRYTYLPPPAVSSLSPNAGPQDGGTAVRITGGGFSGATQVLFGRTVAPFTVADDGHIDATAPAGSAGTVDVTVTTSGGSSAIVPGDRFTYQAPEFQPPPRPVITGAAPRSGPAAGGTAVTITGRGFTDAGRVLFNTSQATFTILSDTTIRATAPAGTGTVDIRVTTPGGTNATGPADHFTYVPVGPPTVSRPSIVPHAYSADTTTAFNPQGKATTVRLEYGLDGSLREQPTKAIVLDQATSTTSFIAATAPRTLRQRLDALVPLATYHVRLVATNSDGTTYGPDRTFRTTRAADPPPPTLGQDFNAVPTAGRVFVRLPGTNRFVPLTQVRQLPSGTIVDTRHGSIRLIIAGPDGRPQSATFSGAIFRFSQATQGLDRGIATLTLVEGLEGVPTYAVCGPHAAGDGPFAHAAVSRRVLALLHANGHGRFRTRGHYAAGTVRGTTWDTADRCDGTLVKVLAGTVEVQNLTTGRLFILPAPGSYLAPRP